MAKGKSGKETAKKGGGDKGPKKRTLEKQKQKIFEDKTFGMKNKNKSKRVQNYIQGMKKATFMGSKKDKLEQEERERKKLEKLAQKQREKELRSLFRTVEDKKKEEEEEKKTVEDVEKEIEEEIKEEAELTIEEIIEKERAKIIEGTKVTKETFEKWKAFKEEQKRKALEAQKKLEKGLTGRELFEKNASAFVDDTDAVSKEDYVIQEDVAVDDDLFLEDEEDVIMDDQVYDPKTWEPKDKPPKALLQEMLQGMGIKEMPVYKEIDTGNNKEFKVLVTLPHLKKDFIPQQTAKSKKFAEHNAALIAINYMKKLQGTNEEKN